MSDPNERCPVCGKPMSEHHGDQFGVCLKRGDLEHIRRTGKPIIETLNGVTRQVDADVGGKGQRLQDAFAAIVIANGGIAFGKARKRGN